MDNTNVDQWQQAWEFEHNGIRFSCKLDQTHDMRYFTARISCNAPLRGYMSASVEGSVYLTPAPNQLFNMEHWIVTHIYKCDKGIQRNRYASWHATVDYPDNRNIRLIPPRDILEESIRKIWCG